MEQVGFSLIDKNNKEIQHWGEYGSFTSMPEVIWLPNGDVVNAPSLYGDYSEFKLVKRFVENTPPGQFFNPLEIIESFKNGDILLTYYYGNSPNVTPNTVTPLQFRKALNQLNKRKFVDDYVSTLDQDSKDAWEYAILIDRGDPIFEKAVIDGKITVDEIDDIFRLASTL